MEHGNIKKTIIVTAGCAGIGGEITRHLLANGNCVIATTRNLQNGQKFRETLPQNEKENCVIERLIMDSEKEIDCFLQCISGYNIYALINCASNREAITDPYELSFEAWERHFSVGVYATAYLSALVAENVIEKHGSIINLSSFYSVNIPDNRIYDENTIPTSLIYGTEKAALNYITQYMAVKYASVGITVNAILAGGVRNKDRQSDFFYNEYCKRTPAKRMAQENEFNAAVDFLLDENNKFCTGQLISIDGGWGLL